MSHSPQEFSYKKVTNPKSQGWSWPHLAAVPKKPATTSLHTPDEQTEVSPTATEENTVHQSSPPRSPNPLATSASGSATPHSEADLSEDQNTQHNKDDTEQKPEANTHVTEEKPQHEQEAGLQHNEKKDPSQGAEELNHQHAENSNTVAPGPERLDETPSGHNNERPESTGLEPCSGNKCDHGEESSKPSFEETAEAEKHEAHDETTERTSESPESSMLHDQSGEVAVVKS